MAGEAILIVDDTPVNLKLTRILLLNEGYKVLTAASAEEAIELLRSYRPALVLADIQLPGMDGLELTRRIKQDEATRGILVVALTAFAMKGDEQKAIDAGCDGYITKPIDTRALGARIREYLNLRAEMDAKPAAPASEGAAPVTVPEMQALRRAFLEEGLQLSRQWLLDLDGPFSPNDASRSVHQWIGSGGLLGYSAISRLAREVEAVLLERPLDNAQLRESLTNLVLAFSSPREARDAPVPESILRALCGKQVAVIGFPAHEEERVSVALERAQATGIFLERSAPEESGGLAGCDLAVLHVHSGTAAPEWLNTSSQIWSRLPVVLVGKREDLLALDPGVQSAAREFLMEPWQPDEALVRFSLALSQRPGGFQSRAGSTASAVPAGRPLVLVADDDPTVLTLVRTALQNFGMECQVASDGPSALEAARRIRPQAAVLDVNMPGMDGYEVLSKLRSDEVPVRVLLLTARQREADVLRGFTLGADDYVIKPFSPMELVARLKRLLGR